MGCMVLYLHHTGVANLLSLIEYHYNFNTGRLPSSLGKVEIFQILKAEVKITWTGGFDLDLDFSGHLVQLYSCHILFFQ